MFSNGLINNIPASVRIMAWCRPGDNLVHWHIYTPFGLNDFIKESVENRLKFRIIVDNSCSDQCVAICVYGWGGRVISRHHYCNVRIWQGWQGHIRTSLLQCAYMAGVAGSYPDIIIAICVYGRGGRVISRHHYCNVRIWQGWQGHIRTSLLQCAYMAGVAGSYPDIIIAMCVYGRGGRVISRHHYCNVRIW